MRSVKVRNDHISKHFLNLKHNKVIVDLPDRFVQIQAPEIEDSPAHLKNPIFCPAVKYIEDKAAIVESSNLPANLQSNW